MSVQVGDTVATDQMLASLSKTSLPQSVILAQADLVSAEKALDDLMNSQLQEAQALQAIEAAEKNLEDLLNPELQQAQALQAIADAQQAVDYYERRARTTCKLLLGKADIDAAKAQVTIAKDALDKAQEKYDPHAGKPETNLTRANFQAQLAASAAAIRCCRSPAQCSGRNRCRYRYRRGCRQPGNLAGPVG